MLLVVAGNFDQNKIIKLIKNALDKGEKVPKAEIQKPKEDNTVNKEEVELSINLKVPKLALGYKMSKKKFKVKDDLELDLYLNMISSLLFGSSSLFRERVREKHLMTSFYTDWDVTDDHYSLLLFAETENPELLVDEIEKEINDMKISKEDLDRYKKVWIANEVKMIDYVDTTVSNIIDDHIRYNKIIDDKVGIIRKMNKKQLDSIVKNLDFKNRSKVILLPSKIITKKTDKKK